MNKKTLFLLTALTVSVLLLLQYSASSDADEADSDLNVLVDFGNGQTYWAAGTGSTTEDVLKSACDTLGVNLSIKDGEIIINGKTQYSISGTVSKWNYYEGSGTTWTLCEYSASKPYDSSKSLALGFYPESITPTVTPDYKDAWTMIRGDALNTGSVNNYVPSTSEVEVLFEYYGDDPYPANYATALYANGHFVFSSADFSNSSSAKKCHLISYNESGEVEWNIEYGLMGYALSTGVIYDGNAYFSAASGMIRCVPLTGENAGTVTHKITLPTKVPSTGSTVMVGAGTMVYDSGHLFVTSSSGQVTCLTPELEVVWSTDIGGAVYPSVPITVADGRIYIGACDGKIYILNEADGSILANLTIYPSDDPEKPSGRVGTPVVSGDIIFISYNDGKGMSSTYSAMAVLKYNKNTNALTYVKNLTSLSIQNNYLTLDPSGDFVYAMGDDTLYKVYKTGAYETLGEIEETHGGLTLVNNTYLYGTDYDSKGSIRVYDTDGTLVTSYAKTERVAQYSMGSTVVVGPYIIATTDGGAMVLVGSLADTPEPGPGPGPGPEPEPTHEESDVKVLIADGSGMYITTIGRGLTIGNAVKDALTSYGYEKQVIYSGSSTNPSGIATLFGLSYQQVDETHYKMWNICIWNLESSSWTASSEMMNKLYADEYLSVLIFYSVTDGSTIDIPLTLPAGNNLVPLTISDTGTRFYIQSQLGSYFVMNGTGNNVDEAFVNACTANSIPYSETNGKYILFGMTPSGDVGWYGFSASQSGWTQNDADMSTLSGSTILYGLCYGLATSLPEIAPGDLFDGGFPSSPTKKSYLWIIPVIILVVALIAAISYLVHIKRTQEMPVFAYIRQKLKLEVTDSKVRRNKLKLLIVCLIGFITTFVMFLCSLAIGPTATLSLPDALSALVSAINKHGENLTFQEIIVYESRLPRAIATLGVGIGLSIAGCVYQAIIRNPLVDPYIMGVSSGAGTFAVAAISVNFTFFGLIATSNYTIPILAIIGGLLAFGLTLIIAEKAGGSSTNYVLAGVIIGLVFGAIQTMLLVTSDNSKLASAMSWLFGSFANVSWNTVWLIFFPAIFLALVPMLWAKELNLVLLGEDQAKQMGLNVRKFNRWMLILASVLTSVCVAFVGIIGFVGMVIPHLARMILGGDHRLVLPASIMMGGALMLFADLLAKMLMIPTELPVGAITTIIGVPVFAYLLIKKGRMYSG